MTEKERKKWEKYFSENDIDYVYYPAGILKDLDMENEERFGLSNFFLPNEGLVIETNATGNVILLTEMMIEKCKERGWRYCVPSADGSFKAVFFDKKKIEKRLKPSRYFVKWADDKDIENEKIALVESDSIIEVVEYYSDIVEIINLTAMGLLPYEIDGNHRYDELDDVSVVSDILSGEYKESTED